MATSSGPGRSILRARRELSWAAWREHGASETSFSTSSWPRGAAKRPFDPALSPWDAAPLLLIVEEAGGRATTVTGERTIYGGSLVTSNGLLHEEFLQVLRPAV